MSLIGFAERLEVRTSPAGDVLFASTRGLKPTEKGYIIALPLDLTTGLISGNPHVNASSGNAEHTPLHRWQTPTSGGWANAIAVCPIVGPKGQVWISLTDSEEGWVWMLQWTLPGGFEVLGSVNLNENEDVWQKDDKRKGEEVVGASVTVWYD
ncbi:hypothetical protein QFC24_004213 [Naganishia onofrii]|uniref:Uncharacterized protein n=1 Tax=Naganishia onofrii TaxID=1851511 RepID=A0ACC2XFT4_9TREE|nr:hypothetical protein QFC24_004213 [Naganishia onofrii]